MDVHQATISVAVMDSAGKLILESLLETKAATILQFLGGLRGSLLVTFEEGTSAAWLYDLLRPHVANVLVCDPRKNALLKDGSKSDRIDARKLAELLRGNYLSPIYHGENGVRTLKELARSYLTITKDLTRVMSRIKAVYRSWAIPSAGPAVYRPRHRAEWLAKIVEPGVRLRAERLYQQLDALEPLRQGARRDLLAESRKHYAVKLLRQIPYLGPIRSALLVALLETPHRFRTKATVVGLQRIRTRDSRQRRIPLCERATATKPRASHRAGPERKLQSRCEKYLQECGDICQHSAGTVPGVLRCTSGQREEAGDGASHPGTEDRSDQFDDLEERRVLRRQRVTSASSLSVSGKKLVPSSWVVVGWVLETLGSREVSDRWSDPVCFGTESPLSRYAPSENQK